MNLNPKIHQKQWYALQIKGTPTCTLAMTNRWLSNVQGPLLSTFSRSSLWKNWKIKSPGDTSLIVTPRTDLHTSASLSFMICVLMVRSVTNLPTRHKLWSVTLVACPSRWRDKPSSSSSRDRPLMWRSILPPTLTADTLTSQNERKHSPLKTREKLLHYCYGKKEKWNYTIMFLTNFLLHTFKLSFYTQNFHN